MGIIKTFSQDILSRFSRRIPRYQPVVTRPPSPDYHYHPQARQEEIYEGSQEDSLDLYHDDLTRMEIEDTPVQGSNLLRFEEPSLLNPLPDSFEEIQQAIDRAAQPLEPRTLDEQLSLGDIDDLFVISSLEEIHDSFVTEVVGDIERAPSLYIPGELDDYSLTERETMLPYDSGETLLINEAHTLDDRVDSLLLFPPLDDEPETGEP